MIFPGTRDQDGRPALPGDDVIRVLAANQERIGELRLRLSSASWFMRCLNEHIARRANREDGCKGRFWEGRYKCQALLDEAAVVACMVYVDLNPIRSGLADTPESSAFTSAYDRITAHQAQLEIDQPVLEHHQNPGRRSGEKRIQAEVVTWLCPLNDNLETWSHALLSLSTDEYLELLDWTGRHLSSGKTGAIPSELLSIMDRLQVKSERWLDTVQNYGRSFHRVAGRMESILAAARQAGKRWLCGLRAGRTAFSET